MKHTAIAFLLLAYTLLAHAVSDDSVFTPPKAERATAPLSLHPTLQQEDDGYPLADGLLSEESDEADLDDEAELADLQPNKNDTSYDNLSKVMPQLGYGVSARKSKADEQKSDDSLSIEIEKLAALPRMRSSIVLIYDEKGDQILRSKNADVVTPIASITKLMTAMVVLDAKLPLDEEISIESSDINRKKRTRSRTRVGMTLSRGELLKLALMASDNLSAAALARTYPGGTEAALEQMNTKARELGMYSSRFTDPTGLSSGNVSTANDLVKMVQAAKGYELINEFSTSTSHTVELAGRRPLRFHNTNPLVRNASWDIGLSKTGYISEAGRCLVMEAKITEHPVIIVLLDSWGRNSRVGDANRVKKWMEKASVKTRNM